MCNIRDEDERRRLAVHLQDPLKRTQRAVAGGASHLAERALRHPGNRLGTSTASPAVSEV